MPYSLGRSTLVDVRCILRTSTVLYSNVIDRAWYSRDGTCELADADVGFHVMMLARDPSTMPSCASA